jgi:hypothetical protein
MRMLMHAKIPHSTFNAAVKDGTVGQKIHRMLEDIKPEAAYFTNYDGHRGLIMIVDVADPSKVPAFAEPFFLTFEADVEFHVVISPEELGRADLAGIAKKWA